MPRMPLTNAAIREPIQSSKAATPESEVPGLSGAPRMSRSRASAIEGSMPLCVARSAVAI